LAATTLIGWAGTTVLFEALKRRQQRADIVELGETNEATLVEIVEIEPLDVKRLGRVAKQISESRKAAAYRAQR